MGAVTIVFTFGIRPGLELEADEVLGQMAAAAHGEPGCLKYAIYRASHDAAQRVIFEVFSSQESYQAHATAGTTQGLLGRLLRLVDADHKLATSAGFPEGLTVWTCEAAAADVNPKSRI